MSQDKETPIQENDENMEAAIEQDSNIAAGIDPRQADASDTAAPGTDAKADESSGEVEAEIQSDPLDQELQRLRKEADENYQRYLRTQADFDNFRRRARQEKEESAKYAAMGLLEELLPVIDNLERAVESARKSNDSEALCKGIEMIVKQFLQAAGKQGLQPMEAEGQAFNPEYHQAIMQVDSDEHEQGIVVEEVQKGYMLKDRVLRPAMVKVSS